MTTDRPTLTSPDRAARRSARLLAAATAFALPLAGLALPATPAAAGAECATNGITVTSLNPPMFYTDIRKGLNSGYAGYQVTSADARKNLWIELSTFTGGQLGLNTSQPAALPLGNLTAGKSVPSFSFLTATAVSSVAQNHVVKVYAGRPGAAGSALLCSGTGGFAGVQDTIEAGTNNVVDTNSDLQAVYLSTTTPQLGQAITVRIEGKTGQIGAGSTIDPNGLYMTPTALSSWPASAFRLTGTSLTIPPADLAAPQTFVNILRRGNLGSDPRNYEASYTFTATGSTSSSTQLFPIQQIASGTQVKHTNLADLEAIPMISPVENPLRVSLTPSSTSLPSTGGTVTYTATLTSTSAVTSQVDELVFTLPEGATYSPGSATLGAQPTTEPVVDGRTLTFSGPFSTSSATPVVATVSVQIPGIPGSYTTDAYGLLAGTVIDTSSSTVDSVPSSTAVTVASSGAHSAQTITFPPLEDTRIDNAPPVLSAVATSGLDVGYTSKTPDTCSVTDGSLTMLGAGLCTVQATQGGNGSWSVAPPVSQSFTIGAAPQAQTITFEPLSATKLGTPAPALTASSSSQLPVGFTSLTTDVCTIDSNGALLLLAEGECTVEATQPGNSTWEPASAVSRTFTVLPADVPPAAQTITFEPLGDVRIDGQAPALTATSSSTLPVDYTSTTPDQCTVTDGVITLVGPGTCTIKATQAGNGSWEPAAAVSRSFTVSPVPPLVVSDPGSGQTTGTVPAPVSLPGLPAGAVLSIAPSVLDAVRGVASVTITGGTVQVVADPDFSGVITLPVTVTADGQSVVVEVRVVVLPVAAVTPSRRLAGPTSSVVAWTPSPNATGYEVRLNGVVVCTTLGTSCSLPGLVGPSAVVEITALGNDATRSTIVLPPYQQKKGVHVTDVYFASDSARLTRASRMRLDKVAAVMVGQGFRHVLLSGHTDSRSTVAYNKALSKKRAMSVKRYLDIKLKATGVRAKVSHFASTRPAGPNSTARGRALNRRTGVALR